MKKILTLISLAALLSGCASNIKNIGSIGNYDYYKIHGRSLDGPNFSVLVVAEHGCPEAVPVPVTAVGGPGIGSALIGAGGTIGAATVFGGAIRPATTVTTVSGGNTSAHSSTTATAESISGAAGTGGSGGNVNSHNNTHNHTH
jgi:hypothetical protein